MTQAPTVDNVSPMNEVSDADWLRDLKLRKSGNEQLRAAAKTGDAAEFQEAWLVSVSGLAGKEGEKTQDSWKQIAADSRDAVLTSDDTLVREFAAERSARPLTSVAEVGDLITGLSTLAWRSNVLDAVSFVTLLRWCVEQSQNLIEQTHAGVSIDSVDALRAATELPVVAGLLFRDLKGTKSWTLTGRKVWESWWDEQTDNDGTIHARWLDSALPVVQSLARAESFARLYGESLLGKRLTDRFQRASERLLSLATPGRFLTFRSEVPAVSPLAMANALKAIGFRRNSPVRGQFELYGANGKNAAAGTSRSAIPDASHQSDWAEWAAMRNSWEADVDQIVVEHSGKYPQVNIVLNGEPLFCGTWNFELKIDGALWNPSSAWGMVCTFDDDEASYFELQQQDETLGLTVTRQFFLNKSERFVLLAEIVKCDSATHLEYRSDLPVTHLKCVTEQDSLTREQAVTFGKQRARVLPLAWPQDRFTNAHGAISIADGKLQIREDVHATGFCVPVLFEARKERRNKPVDWSVLHIAEDGKFVAAEESCGRRFRIGREQWIYFHNLKTGTFSRSLMGMHTNHETVVARFTNKGDFEPLLQVEP
ncbi:MAG: hypothetical protein KDA88_18460 [Planctomycetaceae bacterium]|nr:hypothetical protein [Planctomycetaceae bacterium]